MAWIALATAGFFVFRAEQLIESRTAALRIFDIHAREILRLRQRMNELLAEHTGKPVVEIARDTERDYHMTSDEALTYGLLDRVVRRRELIPQPDNRGGSRGTGGGQGS